MEYEDIEPYMQTRQLLGWTKNLWKKQSGELWFVSEHGLCIVNSEFRKDDKIGQCPSLHETELENIRNNEIGCDSLGLYICAHATSESNLIINKMLGLTKDYLEILYEHQFAKDLVCIQDNYNDISRLLTKCKLSISDFIRWLYLYIKELKSQSIITNNNLISDNDSRKSYKSNWHFKTWIVFSPTSNNGDEYITVEGHPCTRLLYGAQQSIQSHWSMCYALADKNLRNSMQKSHVAAKWMSAALLAYVADESRKKLLGTELDWLHNTIDFTSRDFEWAIHKIIEVNKLNFRIDGRKLYDAYLKDRFEDAKEQFRLKPKCELITDDEIWSDIYNVEMKHWKEDQPLKDILPEAIYTQYTIRMEAYFAYFRAKHPCVCKEDETVDDSSNPQTTQPVEKTEDEKQDDKGTESIVTSSSSSFLWPQYTPQATEEDKRDFERFLKKLCTEKTKSMTHDIQTFLANKVRDGIINRPSQINTEWEWVKQFGYPYKEKTYYNA